MVYFKRAWTAHPPRQARVSAQAGLWRAAAGTMTSPAHATVSDTKEKHTEREREREAKQSDSGKEGNEGRNSLGLGWDP